MDNKNNFDFDAVDLNEFLPLQEEDICDIALYEKNLSALSKHHPNIVELIDPLNIDKDKIKVISSKSGKPRLLYRDGDKEAICIHSTDDPVRCAEDAANLLGEIEKEGIIVLFGFGLGYFAEEIFKRFEKGHVLLIYDAVPEIFKAALHLKDFSHLFESESVRIALGENIENPISTLAGFFTHVINGKFWVVKHHPSVGLKESAYEKFYKMLDNGLLAIKTNANTAVHLGSVFVDAFLKNIPTLIRNPGVSKLKDMFDGCCAVIVSAGPSLDKNLHLLRKLKGKAIIIAVEAALPTLMPCGIVPDIVVAIDPLEKNIELFRDIPDLNKIIFILLPQHTPAVLNMYPGMMFLNSIPYNVSYQMASNFIEDKGYIEQCGGSVAHFAFSTARYIGAKTIVLMGQDLSFNPEKSHTKGFVDVSEEILKEAGRKKDMRKVINEYAGTFQWVDVFNEKVLTRSDLLSFKMNFEEAIKNFDGGVINATEGGVSIEGAANIRLVDFIDEYSSGLQEIDVYSKVSSITDNGVSCNMEGLLSSIEAIRARYKEIKKASMKILKYIKIIQSMKAKEQQETLEFHNILEKAESITKHISHPSLNLLVNYNMSLELYLHKQTIKGIDEIEDKWEKLEEQLERGQHYYKGLIDTITGYNRQLDNLIIALKREKEIDSILSDESSDAKTRFYKAAMIYKKAGMTAQAVKYLLEAVTGDRSQVTVTSHGSRITDVHSALAEMYMKQFRFYNAREILEKVVGGQWSVVSGQEQGEKIKKLSKICDEKIKAWENRKREMSKLLKKAEESYGGYLESGYFYFRIKDYERSEKAYLKAVSSDQGSVISKQLTDHRQPTTGHLAAAYYGLAHTYLAMSKPEKAVEALEKAIEVDPQNPLFYRDLGFIAYQNGNVESAEAFFTRAIELAPQSVELFKLLADSYVGQGEIEKAIALYEDALLANPNHSAIQQELALLYKELISKTGRA
ncbi:MAG: DUF115 domain-containing protein [Nitrospirae bacterium]|nr:DUF115 domain-containing protein [Nitrospirota bacterium]MCL5978939.1 DUF115 domain-containing protein [Nitrospirota bacterium]